MRDDIARQLEPEPNGSMASPVEGAGVLEVAGDLRAEHDQAPVPSAISSVLAPAPTVDASGSTAAALLRVLIVKLSPEDRRVEVTVRELEDARGTLVISAAKGDPMAPAMVLELR